MSTVAKAYIEHVAVWVKDIHWHIRFFREVLGMEMREVQGDPGDPAQYWTLGGLQFIAAPDFAGPEGRLGHLGVMCEDQAAAIAAAADDFIRRLGSTIKPDSSALFLLIRKVTADKVLERLRAEGIAALEQSTGIRFAVENMYPWRASARAKRGAMEMYLPGWDPSEESYAHTTIDLSHAAIAASDVVEMAGRLGGWADEWVWHVDR